MHTLETYKCKQISFVIKQEEKVLSLNIIITTVCTCSINLEEIFFFYSTLSFIFILDKQTCNRVVQHCKGNIAFQPQFITIIITNTEENGNV